MCVQSMSGALSLAGCSGGTCIKLAQYLMSMISSEWAEAKGDGLVVTRADQGDRLGRTSLEDACVQYLPNYSVQ